MEREEFFLDNYNLEFHTSDSSPFYFHRECVLGTGTRTAIRTLPEPFSHLLYEKRDVCCEMIMTARGIIPEPLKEPFISRTLCVAVFHPSVYQIV